MVDEKLFVVRSFRENFSHNEKIAIYGLGKNTQLIIEECSDYNLIGLLDKNRTGETEWGMPIISVDEAHDLGVEKIVIIAISANVPLIYRRIADKCEEYGIKVYDINGEQKKTKTGKYVIDSLYQEYTIEKLKKKIDNCDVVSFDIFDTLLVREVLYPTDVFEIVSKKNCKYFPEGFDFPKQRISSERYLYLSHNPTINEIYARLVKETGIEESLAAILMESEILEEKKNIKARCKMREILKYALSQGKLVCCTSDMYMTKELLMEFLEDAGYILIDKIFVSCEYGVSKINGLFNIVKKEYEGQKILHIGDNYDADIVSAAKYGINDTFRVSSIYKMISDSAVNKILNHDMALSDRCEVGRCFSDLFNNPFIFEKTGGKCEIKDNYSLGYYFFEPIISSFLEWLLEQCKLDNIKYLLLGSRDGWILKKLLDIRRSYEDMELKYEYLYTSRLACTIAGMKTSKDVKYAFKMSFNGSAEQLLRQRFGLKQNEILKRANSESEEKYLNRHIDCILGNAKKQRNRYCEYLKSVRIEGEKVGFFDFVSSGTCQLWLENIWPETSWNGYYFIKVLDKYKEKLHIKSYFASQYVYEKQSELYKNYVFMENVMTSPEPTLHGFSDEGTVVFEQEFREEEQINQLIDIHRGILDAYKYRLDKGERSASREVVDDILDIVNSEYSIMSADFFCQNILEDDFCNRKFDLKKIVGLSE